MEDLEVRTARASASAMAPTDSPLDVFQPQSNINLETIQNSLPPTADYAMIANLAPSVSNFSTNGPGLNESKPTLRGFTDGQYNVTMDGIPFGDGNDYTHHTTSYFPAKLLGRVTVDRGPGDASTIGMATFGGTIALSSKDPRREASFVPTLSDGSYNTRLANFEINTGLLPKANGASLVTSYQYMESDGYRTLSKLKRDTYFLKYWQPLTSNTRLTLYGSYNDINFNNPNASTLTQTQINTLGRNFGQDADPTDYNNYYGYSYQIKHTDLEYIGINTRLENWNFEDKAYSFNYTNYSHESPNNTSGTTKTDIGGQFKVNVVRTFGNYFVSNHKDSFGELKFGYWYDYQYGPRYNYYIDYNQSANTGPILHGGMLDTTHKSSVGGYAYDMHYYTKTNQPFVEYSWNVLPNLSIQPGVKYLSVNRTIEARVNQTKDQLPAYYDKIWSETLPSVVANYRISNDWSTYAQFAKGMLTPALATLQVDHPETTNLPAQTTTNYQLGTVYKKDRFSGDVDVYYIDYKHYPLTQQNPANPTNANDVIYTTASGARFSGIEAQGTYYVGGGLSVFANGSLNYAKYKISNRKIESVPSSTAAFGAVIDASGFNISLSTKYVGYYWVYSGAPSPDLPLPSTAITAKQGGYALVNLAISHTWKFQQGSFFKSLKAKVEVDNALDRQVQLMKTVNANPMSSTYNVLEPFNFYFTVSAQF